MNQRIGAGLLAGGVSFSLASAQGATLRVPADYPTIAVGLDSSASGDTVLVAPGTYTDTIILEYARAGGATFTVMGLLKDGVALKSEAGPKSTILDMSGANIVGTGIYLPGYDLNSGNTLVEGFTFAPPQPGTQGMTITFSEGGVTTIRDCHFRGFDGSDFDVYGGAILISIAHVSIEDCSFEDCVAYSGGAIWAGDSSVWIDGTSFRNCSSVTGAVTSLTPSIPNGRLEVRRSEFIENVSPNGAGAGIWKGGSGQASLKVEDCWFESNVAAYGGAVAATGNGAKHVTRTVFVANSASVTGGALSIGEGMVDIENSTFYGNTESGSDARGSALLVWGTCRVTNNVFAANSGSEAMTLGFQAELVEEGCNDFWNNPDGDTEGFTPSSTDLFVDPQFCGEENGDFTLSGSSPCLPSGNEACGLIGAFEQGCGMVSIERTSWGRIKGLYRTGE